MSKKRAKRRRYTDEFKAVAGAGTEMVAEAVTAAVTGTEAEAETVTESVAVAVDRAGVGAASGQIARVGARLVTRSVAALS